MSKKTRVPGSNRRAFLARTAGLLAAAPAASAVVAVEPPPALAAPAPKPAPLKSIPIGVFTSGFEEESLDVLLDKLVAVGLEAVEVGAGNLTAAPLCPTEELLADPAKARAWKKKFDDRNIRIGALSCHGNALNPNPEVGPKHAEGFRRTVMLAERLEVPVVVDFSGCPGDSPTGLNPNWVTYLWPPEYKQVRAWQWKERVIPYWKEAAKFAQQHHVKVALEMFPGCVVYNPLTLLQLRREAGEAIGANCDLSHLFWQGVDPLAVIRLLASEGALYHTHMKDTVLYRENTGKYGVLNWSLSDSPEDRANASLSFRAVGYGRSGDVWKDIVRTYMEVGFQGILSIENEDPFLPGEAGARASAEVLKTVRRELLASNK